MLFRLGLFALGALLASAPPTRAQSILSPDEFAGFEIGSDGNLLRWERIVEYFETADERSDRVLVERLGETNNGNPFLLATISAPKNLARLDEIRANQRRIAHPEGLTEKEIERLAWESPAVVLVSYNIHATEIAASQSSVELVHELATSDSPWTRHVLDNVVFLLVPSFNPDGQIMVVDWNNRVRGTKHVWASLPYLYHPYVGHDNNRDAYMMTQPESRYVNKVLFQDWFPQVYVDQHQQGNTGMRVFVPPFRNPINPNVDPAVWAMAGRIGFGMYQRLHDDGFTGVGYDQKYTAWWQGGFLRGAWFHNTVGMLTEVASANLASPVYQEEAELGQPPRNRRSRNDWLDEREQNPDAPMPPPEDVMPRYDYPRPWLGGKWTLRDVVDAQLSITRATLESAANDRVRLIRAQILMGMTAIEKGRTEAPWAYVFRPDQHDRSALYTLLEALHYAGIEVDRATSPFDIEGETFPKGSYVISMAQPFRAYAKDLLEPQEHPDPAAMPEGKMGDQPYDLTAWSLPVQMGVEAVAVPIPFKAELERLSSIPEPEIAFVGKGRKGWLISPTSNRAATAVNRFLAAGMAIARIPQAVSAQGREIPPGAVWVTDASKKELEPLLDGLGVEVLGADKSPERSRSISTPRTALYRPWTASMDEGWTRWLLEQYEFPFEPLRDGDVRQGDLRERWDVIILPGDRSDSRLVKGNYRESTPEEYRGGLGESGRAAIRRFVAQGGTLITWGDAVEFALRTFELPLRNGLAHVPTSEFSSPGSFLRIQVDTDHAIAHGMTARATALFKNDAVLEPLPGFSYTDFTTIARYPGSNLLESGWIRGEEYLANRIAAAEARYRNGKVVLIAFRPQFRAQPHETFKLLFNTIHAAGEGRVR